MVTHIARVWINRVKLPVLHVVGWTGKFNISLSAFVPEIWSHETGSPVPSRVSLLISILIRLNLVLTTYGISPEFRGGVHLFIYNRHTPSSQSRVYRVTQLRIDGVHCRESAGTGPVNLKVVPNECCFGRSPWTNYFSPLFPYRRTIDRKAAAFNESSIKTKTNFSPTKQNKSSYILAYRAFCNCCVLVSLHGAVNLNGQ